LQELSYSNKEIVLVDNGSEDDSIGRFKEIPYPIKLIESEKNLGFAGGCNLGIQYAMEANSDYIWLLNNDAIAENNALSALVDMAEKYRSMPSLVGSVLYYQNGELQLVGSRIKWWTGRQEMIKRLDKEQEIDCLSGSSILIPRVIIEKIGLLREWFFLYWEDSEYSLRARRGGFQIKVCAESKVYHHMSRSTNKIYFQKEYYLFRNRLFLWRLYANKGQYLSGISVSLIRLGIAFVTGLRINRENREINQLYFRAYLLAWKDYWRGITGQCPIAGNVN
jgi:GT2 family glycosyltransferase